MKLRVTSCLLRVTSCLLRVTSCKDKNPVTKKHEEIFHEELEGIALRVTSCLLRVPSCKDKNPRCLISMSFVVAVRFLELVL